MTYLRETSSHFCRSLIEGSAVVPPPLPGNAAVAELAKTAAQQARSHFPAGLWQSVEVMPDRANGCVN